MHRLQKGQKGGVHRLPGGIIRSLVAWFSLFAIAQGGDAPFTFRTTGSLIMARDLHSATVLPNGNVLVAGGVNSDGAILATAELYDQATGTWTGTGSLNTARDLHTATLLPNGKVLIAGGTNGGTLASAELYDPVTGSWTSTGNLNTGRRSHTATLLPSGRVLVAGGVDGSGHVSGSAEL